MENDNNIKKLYEHTILSKINKDDIPEVFLSNDYSKNRIQLLLGQSKIKKIGPALYTSNMVDDINLIVNRNLWKIVGLLYPNAVISDRTGIELKPTNNTIFIRTNKTRPTSIGHITIEIKKGEKLDSDMPFMNSLYLASVPRLILENTQKSLTTRAKNISRGLNRKELEAYINDIITKKGEDAINRIRDEMRPLSKQLGLDKEFEIVNKIISTLLQTHTTPLHSETAIARSKGFPYDERRIILFTKLYQELEKTAPIIRLDKVIRNKTSNNTEAYNIAGSANNSILPFFESYFSNFIEGTKFAVEEAEEIIFQNKIPQNRPEDAHDITGTYQVVSNTQEMSKTPRNFDEFIDLLRSRHKILMHGRKITSDFKTKSNQAGSTLFVQPDLVMGTFREGFKIYQKLTNAFSKALFIMFLVSEVHPFDDGNGRMARIMLNSELVSCQEQRIIIPTIYRNNYLQALKAISQNGITEPIIKMLDFAQRYTALVDWSNFDTALDMLAKTNAFMDPSEADEIGIRLILP